MKTRYCEGCFSFRKELTSSMLLACEESSWGNDMAVGRERNVGRWGESVWGRGVCGVCVVVVGMYTCTSYGR